MNRYLCFDTECGGLHKETSLLTVYFAVLDSNLNILDELDLKLSPENGLYVVESQGLEINKINLVEHDKEAIKYKEAKTLLYKFLEKNTYNGEKFTPLGQNVIFDVERIKDVIISAGAWDNFVSHRVLDTMLVARFLQANGKLPNADSVSLSYLVDYFGIFVEGEMHEAKTDVLATVEVYKKLVEIIK